MRPSALLIIFNFIFFSASALTETLTLSTDKWSPYENIQNTEAAGFSTEVISEVLSLMEIKSTIFQAPFARVLHSIYSGQIDGGFSLLSNPERASYCHFPDEPIFTAKYYLFIRQEDQGKLIFDSLDDLRGKSIAITRRAAYPPQFLDYVNENSKIHINDNANLSLKMLLSHRVDYIVAEHFNMLEMAKELKASKQIIPLRNKMVKEGKFYLAFSKKTVTPEFTRRFSRTLKSFKQSKKYQQLFEKYFPEEQAL